MTDYLTIFLALDLGVLIGMALTAFFIGTKGCYEGCLLQDPPKD